MQLCGSLSILWHCLSLGLTSLVAQMVKLLPTMQETQVRSLGWEDPVEKEMATHSSTLAWKIPWTEERGSLQSMGMQRVGHDWTTSLRDPWWLRGYSVCLQWGRPRFDPWVRKIPSRRNWQSTPLFLPWESHGGRSLVGYSPWDCKESDTTEWLHFLWDWNENWLFPVLWLQLSFPN